MLTVPTVDDRYDPDDVERFYASGAWTEQTLSDLVDERAHELGDRTFATDATTALSFAELRERSIRIAAGLRRGGVERGDRIAVQLPNWTDFVVAVAAISRCGAIVVPIMPIYRRDEVSYVLSDCEASAAITCESFNKFEYAAMYRSLVAEHDHLACAFVARAAEEGEGVRPLSSLEVDGDLDILLDEIGPPGGADDPHLIVYTSGTTARPKGCVHTFNTLGFTVRTMAKGLQWQTEDIAFGPSPVTHATGDMTSVLIPLFAGGATHLMEAWEPSSALQRIAKHRCMTAVTATVFLKTLTDAYDRSQHDPSSLRVWVCAGSPIPPAVIELANEALPQLEVLSLYGRSENMVTTLCNVGDDAQLSLTSDGCAPEGVRVQIVDREGTALPAGQEGDITYRGPGHMLAYLGDAEQTDALFTAAGGSRSGDLGVMNEQGYVRVTGRIKDIIGRGGMNISAREIEELIAKHPDVKDVAVIAVPDDRLGEQVCACVVPTEGRAPTLDDLISYLCETRQMAAQKLPERIHVVDALPMTATGKVQKHLLRAAVVG